VAHKIIRAAGRAMLALDDFVAGITKIISELEGSFLKTAVDNL